MSEAPQLGWRVAAASVQGSSHLRDGTPCQDVYRWREPAPGWLVVAVADGAGSVAQAERGAKLSVDQAVAQAAALVLAPPPNWDKAVRELVRNTREAVIAEAGNAGINPQSFASTLLVLMMGPQLLVTGHIGDGAIVGQHCDGSFETISKPAESEYLNETVFLVSPEALELLQVVVRNEAPAALAILTDGLQLHVLEYPGWEPFRGFFSPLFAHLGSSTAPADDLAQLLRSEHVRRRTSDDVTLVVAVQPAEGDR